MERATTKINKLSRTGSANEGDKSVEKSAASVSRPCHEILGRGGSLDVSIDGDSNDSNGPRIVDMMYCNTRYARFSVDGYLWLFVLPP